MWIRRSSPLRPTTLGRPGSPGCAKKPQTEVWIRTYGLRGACGCPGDRPRDRAVRQQHLQVLPGLCDSPAERDSKIELQWINPSDQEGEPEDSHEGDGGARFPPPGRARNWSPVDSFFKLFVVTEVSAGQYPPANFIPGLRKKQSLECT